MIQFDEHIFSSGLVQPSTRSNIDLFVFKVAVEHTSDGLSKIELHLYKSMFRLHIYIYPVITVITVDMVKPCEFSHMVDTWWYQPWAENKHMF